MVVTSQYCCSGKPLVQSVQGLWKSKDNHPLVGGGGGTEDAKTCLIRSGNLRSFDEFRNVQHK